MTTAILLIVLGTLARLAPHPPNAVAIGALALYAGSRLPRRWAFLVPLAAMLASDAWIDWGTGRSAFGAVRLTIYATFALMVVMGRTIRGTDSPWVRSGVAAVGSTLFFLSTNFAIWAAGDHAMYPATASGLALCYTAALPFFGNALVADLIGTAVLFGLDGLSQRAFHARPKPVVAAE